MRFEGWHALLVRHLHSIICRPFFSIGREVLLIGLFFDNHKYMVEFGADAGRIKRCVAVHKDNHTDIISEVSLSFQLLRVFTVSW